jgi:hypothetical protein
VNFSNPAGVKTARFDQTGWLAVPVAWGSVQMPWPVGVGDDVTLEELEELRHRIRVADDYRRLDLAGRPRPSQSALAAVFGRLLTLTANVNGPGHLCPCSR